MAKRERRAYAPAAVTALNFAVVSSDPAIGPVLGRFCGKLSLATGLSVQPLVLGSYSALLERARSGEAQVLWAPPLVAIELEDGQVASPVVVVQRSIRAGYHAALVARADSEFKTVDDLRGVRVGWVSRESASGYFVPRWHLRSMGKSLAGAFAEERFCDSHEGVTRAVIDGTVDVGATHVGLDPVSGKLAAAPWLALPDAPPIRVIFLVGPIPGDVIAIGRRVDAGARRHLVEALVVTKDDEDGRLLFETSRFEPVPEGHLDLLRRLARYSDTRA